MKKQMKSLRKVVDALNVGILMGMAGSANAGLFDSSVTTDGGSQSASNLADTINQTIQAFGPVVLSIAQLAGLGLGALTFWFMHQNGQQQNEGRGYMKKALYAGVAAGGLYLSPRFVGMAGRTLLPS